MVWRLSDLKYCRLSTRTTSLYEHDDQEIADKLRSDPSSLGPMSVGTPNAGALFNGIQMPRATNGRS